MSSLRRLPIVIFGCGGHGRVVADTLKVAGAPLVGFLDDRPPASFVSEIPVLGDRGCLEEPEFLKNHEILIAIGEARFVGNSLCWFSTAAAVSPGRSIRVQSSLRMYPLEKVP